MPPDGDAWWLLVDKALNVVGEVFFRKGHIERDWFNKASMMMSRRLSDTEYRM